MKLELKFKKAAACFSAVIFVTLCLTGCAGSQSENAETKENQNMESQNSESTAEESSDENPEGTDDAAGKVIILYTNDVHTYINNNETDEDGNSEKLLNYASVKALKDDLIEQGENVILVDDGDFVQGTAYGAIDEGESVLQIMNAVGYQAASLGNHEFDYGQFRTFEIFEEAQFPILSSNFYSVEDGELVLPAYQIIESGGVKVGFIGISTPETITKSTPAYFMDESGENYIYGFYAGEDGQELYSCVQSAIDEIRDQVDYVVALGHLGVNPSSAPYRSTDVIANVSGLDAFIDGHSHTTMEKDIVKDADGKDVVLTQTGSYLNAIGKMTLEDGNIDTELIVGYENYDKEISQMITDLDNEVNDMLGEVIGEVTETLYIYDPENPEVRIIRNHETNLGDLVADSYYYYFNEAADLDCDLVLQNGGGIRSQVEIGQFSYLTATMVAPFGNVACLVEASGQDILDALEKGAAGIGDYDEETGAYVQNGGFMHVAGIKYTIDTSIPSTITEGENGEWISGPTGEYRVTDVEVYNKSTGKYEPLELDKYYRVGGINYTLRNQGDGLTMLADTECIVDYVGEDYLIISEYVKSFAENDEGVPAISTANSPLSAYSGYLLDYENPYGAGRITILD